VVDLDAALGHPIGPVLDRAGVARLLGQARALVLAPRWTENAPLVVLEARAMGCPIIAPRSGGFVELVEDGVDGWLFDPDSPAALLAAVRSALEGPLPTPRRPPALRDQVAAIESVYRELLAESPCA
jgi:glycosyltransferase involved in cell wall biosynthesis